MINTNLINRKVAVIKTDGFTKLGILKHIDRNFIVLQLLNGDEEIISFGVIDTIKSSEKREDEEEKQRDKIYEIS